MALQGNRAMTALFPPTAYKQSVLILLALTAGCAQDARTNPSSTDGPDLIVNGGFERFRNDGPENWIIDAGVRPLGQFESDQDKRCSGRTSLRLVPNARNVPGPRRLCVAQLIAGDKLEAGDLTVEACLAGENGCRAVVLAACLDAKGRELAKLRLDSTSSDFAEASGSLRWPAGGTGRQIIVLCVAEGTTGSAWFDDVRIRAASSAPKSAAPVEPFEAALTIQAGKVIRTIPRTLFGTNVEWIDDGQGLWDPSQDSLDERVVAVAKQSGIGLVRFPGGVFSDHYHWKLGQSPRSERLPTRPFPSANAWKPNLGTVEIVDFTRAIGADLLLTVNAGSGTADEAADWVSFMNDRAAPGQTVYWEVGNELYLKPDSPSSEGIVVGPEVYARRFIAFADAMRKRNPNIQIGAIGGRDGGRFEFLAHTDWNRVLLREAGDRMDFLAVHNGYAPIVFENPPPPVREVYRALMAMPDQVADNLVALESDLRQHARDRDGRIKLAITEWGPLYQIQPDQRYIDHAKTMGSAIFAAGMLATYVESPRVTIANFFKLTDRTFLGWIGTRDGQPAATAPLLAFQLIAENIGAELVSCEVASPTFSTPAVGIIHARKKVPAIRAFATIDRDRDELVVFVINQDFDRSAHVTIRTQDFAVTNAKASVLHASATDAHTGTELPKVPGLKWAEPMRDAVRSRFDHGGPDEVPLQSAAVNVQDGLLTYQAEPFSVSAIRMRRAP